MTKLRFEELKLSREILDAVTDMGFEEASPIQADAIPLILNGKDIIGQAQTGTGKTAAFAIPIIENLDTESKKIQALILCPTRELVIQVSEEFRKLMKYKENLYVVPVYGGQEIERQLKSLKKGAQVIIGTPGRMMDHMRRGSIKMDSVKIVVLDEADEMLDMGFRDDMEVILKDTPDERQTVMFSATMAQDIVDLTGKFLKEPIIVNVTNKKLNAPKIQQIYFEVLEKNKPEVLARLLDLHNIKLALVFCNTKSQVDQLVEILKTRGYFADALHGDMSQNQRDKVMNGFRNGTVEILVATDVAGRGIDVNDIEAVFNYDLPRDDEDYIHRIGRTARAGKTGIAFTFIVGKQIYNLKRIERANGTQILRQTIPTMDEIEATRINYYLSKIGEIIEAGHLSKYINQIELLMGEEHTSLDIAAALLSLIMEKENEGFDHNANFEIPREEIKPSKNKFSKRSDNKFSKRPSNKFAKKDDFKRNVKKKEFENEYKPYSPSPKKRSDSFEEQDFSNKKRKDYRNNNTEESYKPFKSSENKKTNSLKEKQPAESGKTYNRENKFKKEDRGFKSSEKNKNSSFKEAKSSKERYGQSNKNKKPGRKFGKKDY